MCGLSFLVTTLSKLLCSFGRPTQLYEQPEVFYSWDNCREWCRDPFSVHNHERPAFKQLEKLSQLGSVAEYNLLLAHVMLISSLLLQSLARDSPLWPVLGWMNARNSVPSSQTQLALLQRWSSGKEMLLLDHLGSSAS